MLEIIALSVFPLMRVYLLTNIYFPSNLCTIRNMEDQLCLFGISVALKCLTGNQRLRSDAF